MLIQKENFTHIDANALTIFLYLHMFLSPLFLFHSFKFADSSSPYLSQNFQTLNLVLQHQRIFISVMVGTWLSNFSLFHDFFFFFNSRYLPVDISFLTKRSNLWFWFGFVLMCTILVWFWFVIQREMGMKGRES